MTNLTSNMIPLSGSGSGSPDAANAGEAGMTFFADGAGGGEWLRVPGWAQYSDQDVTVGSPSQTLATGVRTLWTNDGVLTTIEHDPSDLTVPMWNVSTNKIIPITSFDTYITRLTFSAENYSGVTPYIIIELDIGGALGVIWSETTPLLKGGNQQDISVTIPFFTGTTFIANGGSVYMTYVGGTDCDLFKSSIFIGRESKNFA